MVTPSDFGLQPTTAAALLGGDPATNAAIARAILDGEPGPRRTAVLLNAAAALVVAEVTTDLREAAEMAARAIDSGAAKRTLARWVEVSNEGAADDTA